MFSVYLHQHTMYQSLNSCRTGRIDVHTHAHDELCAGGCAQTSQRRNGKFVLYSFVLFVGLFYATCVWFKGIYLLQIQARAIGK